MITGPVLPRASRLSTTPPLGGQRMRRRRTRRRRTGTPPRRRSARRRCRCAAPGPPSAPGPPPAIADGARTVVVAARPDLHRVVVRHQEDPPGRGRCRAAVPRRCGPAPSSPRPPRRSAGPPPARRCPAPTVSRPRSRSAPTRCSRAGVVGRRCRRGAGVPPPAPARACARAALNRSSAADGRRRRRAAARRAGSAAPISEECGRRRPRARREPRGRRSGEGPVGGTEGRDVHGPRRGHHRRGGWPTSASAWLTVAHRTVGCARARTATRSASCPGGEGSAWRGRSRIVVPRAVGDRRRAPAAVAARTAPGLADAAGERLRVLLVEDDEARRVPGRRAARRGRRRGRPDRRHQPRARRGPLMSGVALRPARPRPARRAGPRRAAPRAGAGRRRRGLRAHRPAGRAPRHRSRSPRAPRTTWSRARSTGCC